MLRNLLKELTDEFFVVTWTITLFFAVIVMAGAWAWFSLIHLIQQ